MLWQRLYKKNRESEYQPIFNKNSVADSLTSSDVWLQAHFLQKESLTQMQLPNNSPATDSALFSSITDFDSVEEVLVTYLLSSSSAGVDVITVSALRKVPSRVLAKLFTLWSRLAWTQWLTQCFLVSRTIFIPKVYDTARPSDLRPISILSVFLRHYHRTLNIRLMSTVPFSFQQCVFQSTDGIGRAIDDRLCLHFKGNVLSFGCGFHRFEESFWLPSLSPPSTPPCRGLAFLTYLLIASGSFIRTLVLFFILKRFNF